jgi:hypothetical protein
MSVNRDRANKWLSRAAILQMAFCGLILIGFIVWMLTSIRPVMENAPDASHWIIPILNSVSQPIGSVIAVVGAYLLLKRKKIGLYFSIVSVIILLINNRWIQFVSVIDWLVFPLFINKLPTQSELNFIYFLWVGIYNACTAAIAALLAVCWRVVKW